MNNKAFLAIFLILSRYVEVASSLVHQKEVFQNIKQSIKKGELDKTSLS